MNTRSLRTSVAAAIGGALLMAGLLVGASLALAQENEEPDVTEEETAGDSLTRVFGFVEDLIEEEAEFGEHAAEDDLARISEELHDDLAPLMDQIKEKINTAIDDAVDSGALTEDQADRARDRVEGFTLPERFPFFERGFRFGFPEDFECFRFHFQQDGWEQGDDCPEFELPEDFPFGPDGFEFGAPPEGFGFRFGPLERFGDDLRGFVEDLDIDLDELRELLESGMSLDEALQELGTDLESLLADAREQALAKVDELVEQGELTEEQAARIKEMLEGVELGAFPFGSHRFDLDFGELLDPDRWGHGHEFLAPWGRHCDGEDSPAE